MTHYNKEREEHNKELAYPQPSDWPEPERIENIALNGGDGLHYEVIENDLLP
jgi:hypothetical protein